MFFYFHSSQHFQCTFYLQKTTGNLKRCSTFHNAIDIFGLFFFFFKKGKIEEVESLIKHHFHKNLHYMLYNHLNRLEVKKALQMSVQTTADPFPRLTWRLLCPIITLSDL